MTGRKQAVLVVGIGNVLLGDEGLGVHVARSLEAMQGSLPENLHVLEAGTALFDVLAEMARYPCVILVDAVRAGREPGTVYRADGLAEIASSGESRPAVSLHELDLSQTLRMAELLGYLPAQLSLLGAEPASMALGTQLSPPLAQAAEKIVALLLNELGVKADSEESAGQPATKARPLNSALSLGAAQQKTTQATGSQCLRLSSTQSSGRAVLRPGMPARAAGPHTKAPVRRGSRGPACRKSRGDNS